MHGLMQLMALTCSVHLLLACACHCVNTGELLQDVMDFRAYASPHTIEEAGGNANQVGQFLINYLGDGAGAKNLSDAVSFANLPIDLQRDAFAEAIKQYMGTPAGTLINAAVLSNQAAAVSQAYAQASNATLQDLCSSLDSAQEASAAAGEAARSSFATISLKFGPDPCKLFQGTEGQVYQNTSISLGYRGPSLDCKDISFIIKQGVNAASKIDCLNAISQLADLGSSSCVVRRNATTEEVRYHRTVLTRNGTCEVAVGLFSDNKVYDKEASVPCFQVATYANNVAVACENLKGTTGGRLSPVGYDNNGVNLFISVDYPNSRFS